MYCVFVFAHFERLLLLLLLLCDFFRATIAAPTFNALSVRFDRFFLICLSALFMDVESSPALNILNAAAFALRSGSPSRLSCNTLSNIAWFSASVRAMFGAPLDDRILIVIRILIRNISYKLVLFCANFTANRSNSQQIRHKNAKSRDDSSRLEHHNWKD